MSRLAAEGSDGKNSRVDSLKTLAAKKIAEHVDRNELDSWNYVAGGHEVIHQASLSLEDIKKEVLEQFPDCDFVEFAEARDYRESLALSHQLSNQADASEIIDSFPDEI